MERLLIKEKGLEKNMYDLRCDITYPTFGSFITRFKESNEKDQFLPIT